MHLRHRWVSLAANPMRWVTYLRGTTVPIIGDGEPITEVLQRCEVPSCNKLRTITLDGDWTMDDITKGTRK